MEGTGLGLTLTKRLVEAMGGTITVDSSQHEGTSVAVELNAAERPRVANPVETDRLELPCIGGGPGTERALILYIEDNLSNLTLVERILAEQANVELVSAMQGRLGLDLASQHLRDLIILDLHLPDIPGEEVLRRLKADATVGEIPVVMLSADASSRQVARLMSQGASDYFTKPLDLTRFLHVLATHLRPRVGDDGHA